ncbi:MAG: F0F1 ATP synthase subunit alpha, partial [Patescibacteria group bacterium]
QIERGRRATEMLKQPQFSPLTVEKEVAVLYALTRGFVDEIPVADVNRFERELLEYLDTKEKTTLEKIVTTKALNDEIEGELKSHIEEFKKSFLA